MSDPKGYEGERVPDPNSKRIAQAKLGLDRNANKKKKKKKVAALEDGPSKAARCWSMPGVKSGGGKNPSMLT